MQSNLKSSIWTNYEFVDYLNVKDHECTNLPNGVQISTMCASCKNSNGEEGLCTAINLDNIYDYMKCSSDDILTIKKSNLLKKTIIPEKKKKRRTSTNKKKSASKKASFFFHQITIVIRVFEGEYNDLNEVKKVNVKIFKNGSIQISGIKKIEYANRAINKLIYKLKEVKAILNEDGVPADILFVKDPNKLGIKNFKLDMVNSNYRVNMQINRDKLYELLLRRGINVTFEKCIRACVIIKYEPKNPVENKKISIFVFQKGNIIITGAKSKEHVIESYNYINDLLLTYKDEIEKKNEDEEEEEIMECFKKVLNENSHKLKGIENLKLEC